MSTTTKKISKVSENNEKLKLQNVKVIFANLTDEGFGTSITIDATDKEIQKKISEWVKSNNIGKEKPGTAKFKIYKPEDSDIETIQFSFKINDFTKYYGKDGLEKKDLGYGAVIDLIANSFPYNNKFGKGFSASVSAILIKEKGKTGADADMEELMNELEATLPQEETVEPIDPFKV